MVGVVGNLIKFPKSMFRNISSRRASVLENECVDDLDLGAIPGRKDLRAWLAAAAGGGAPEI